MKIEVGLPISLFPEGLELVIDENLYTVIYAKTIDDDTGRIEVYLKKEKSP